MNDYRAPFQSDLNKSAALKRRSEWRRSGARAAKQSVPDVTGTTSDLLPRWAKVGRSAPAPSRKSVKDARAASFCALRGLRVPIDVRLVGLPAEHALVPQLAHEHLQREQGEHAEAEHDERHHFDELAHGFEQGVDDGAQACKKSTNNYMLNCPLCESVANATRTQR